MIFPRGKLIIKGTTFSLLSLPVILPPTTIFCGWYMQCLDLVFLKAKEREGKSDYIFETKSVELNTWLFNLDL